MVATGIVSVVAIGIVNVVVTGIASVVAMVMVSVGNVLLTLGCKREDENGWRILGLLCLHDTKSPT